MEVELDLLLKRYLLFQLKWRDAFESDNDKKYQVIFSPVSTHKSNQNYHIINSKERNTFGYNVDSGKFTFYKLNEEGVLIIEPIRLSIKNN